MATFGYLGAVSTAEKRRLPPDVRRRELLDAAIHQFTTRPFAEVSIADVAREANVSKSLVFRYFDDKRSLYMEAIRWALGQFADATDPGSGLPADERFRLGLSGAIDLFERYPHALESVDSGSVSQDPEFRSLANGTYDLVASRIIGRMGIADPSPRLHHAVRTWFGFVRVSTHEWLEVKAVTREQLIDLQIATFRAAVAEALGLTPPWEWAAGTADGVALDLP